MTTRTGRYLDNEYRGIPHRGEASERRCERCHNHIWLESGWYLQRKGTNLWLAFCRKDCAELHIGKSKVGQLLSYEEWCARLTHQAIKKKQED